MNKARKKETVERPHISKTKERRDGGNNEINDGIAK